jgi:hypothetical protein
MSFQEELNKLLDIESFRWSFKGNDAHSNICIWFEHTPSEDRPIGQPLSFDDLERLNDEYNVVGIGSHSDGMTGSKLMVEIDNF